MRPLIWTLVGVALSTYAVIAIEPRWLIAFLAYFSGANAMMEFDKWMAKWRQEHRR